MTSELNFIDIYYKIRLANKVSNGLYKRLYNFSAIQKNGENPSLESKNNTMIMARSICLSYLIIAKYLSAGRNESANLEPSKGGKGIRLNAMSMKLYRADRKKK